MLTGGGGGRAGNTIDRVRTHRASQTDEEKHAVREKDRIWKAAQRATGKKTVDEKKAEKKLAKKKAADEKKAAEAVEKLAYGEPVLSEEMSYVLSNISVFSDKEEHLPACFNNLPEDAYAFVLTGFPYLPDADRRAHLTQMCREYITSLPEACCCCDMLVHDWKTIPPDKAPTKMWTCLCPPEENPLSESLCQQYNVSGFWSAVDKKHKYLDKLSNVLLSPRGVDTSDSENPLLRVCLTCLDSLSRRPGSNIPPWPAIANGNYTGYLDDELWKKCTALEKSLIAPVKNHGWLKRCRGGGQRCLVGHMLPYVLDCGLVLQSVPAGPDVAMVNVMFTGPYTPEQKLRTMTPLQANPDNLRNLFNFYSDLGNEQWRWRMPQCLLLVSL